MQKVLAKFVTAQWGTQVHSLLGKFKPCPFESRQINLYEENNKKCHHFKEIRERLVRACGKHCCSKHTQQWEKSAAIDMKRWRNPEMNPEKPNPEMNPEKPSTPQEGTWERLKQTSPRRPGGDSTSPGQKHIGKELLCISSPHLCGHEEQTAAANCQVVTCLKEKTFLSASQNWALPGAGPWVRRAVWEHMLCTLPVPSWARLQQCHIKKHIFLNLSQQVRYEIKNLSRSSKPSKSLQTNQNCVKINCSAFYRGK